MKPIHTGIPDVRRHNSGVRVPPARPRDQRGHDVPGSAERCIARQPAGKDHLGLVPAIRAGRTAHFTLPALPQAAGLARRATRQVLASWQLAYLREPADLIVSELVANAIQHARGSGSEVGLLLKTDGTRMRVEVHDHDPLPPQPRIPAPLDESGLGFKIIEATADRWGVRKIAQGKAVWADLRTVWRWPCPARP
jgi:anti-sigma regulatory factor (Ser/Thr protein kinase)